MNLKSLLIAASIASTVAFAANAGTLLSDTFNDGATSITPWSGDSVFSSPSSYPGYTGTNANASTDYVAASNTYGITCFTGASGCVDLDGSTGVGNDPAGVLESIANFGPGTDTLTFDLSGNQRGGVAETTDVYIGSQLVFSSGPLASGTPWTSEDITFATATGGHLTFVEVGPSTEEGNLLDNVVFSGSSSVGVPEPANWALMIFGLAGLGGILRRRSRAVAV
jgi:hypothetical protein